jgi:hypothetical protein
VDRKGVLIVELELREFDPATQEYPLQPLPASCYPPGATSLEVALEVVEPEGD